MVRGSLLPLLSTLLVLVGTACGESDAGPAPPTPTATPRFELGVTHTFNSWGHSMVYPAGWLTGVNQRTTFVSELFEDHDNRNWPLLGPPRQTEGYQVTLSLPYPAEYYLSFDIRPEDWLIRQNMSGEWTETQWLGAPAARFTGTVGFGRIVNCLRGNTAESEFLLCLGAPSEQTLDEFMPTWERMLASIKPAGD